MFVRVSFPHKGPDGKKREVGEVVNVPDVEGAQLIQDGHARETTSRAKTRGPAAKRAIVSPDQPPIEFPAQVEIEAREDL